MKLRVVISLFVVIMFSAFSAQAQERFPQFLKHTVKPGETVKSIVEQFSVKSSDFLMLNDFPPTIKLKPGQVVLVRKLKEGERPAVDEANDAPAEEPVKKQPAKETVKEKKEEAAEEQPVKEKKHVSLKETDTKSADGSEKTTRTEKTVTETSKPAPHKEKEADESRVVVEPVKEKSKPAKKEVAEKPETHSSASSAGKTVEGPGGIQYTVSDDGYHTVEKGQTFYRIALIYHLTVDQLRDLNGLPNYNVSVGQKLKVKK